MADRLCALPPKFGILTTGSNTSSTLKRRRLGLKVERRHKPQRRGCNEPEHCDWRGSRHAHQNCGNGHPEYSRDGATLLQAISPSKSGLSGDCEIDDDGEMAGAEVRAEAVVDNGDAGAYQHMVDQQADEGYS